MSIQYGFRKGTRIGTPVRVDSSTTLPIKVGDFLTLATAGYYKQASAGDEPQCVAMQEVPSTPALSADGDVTILADFSKESVYEYPPASGTVTVALIGKKCDVGGAQSADITASVDGEDGDGSLKIINVDTGRNTVYVTINPDFAGV
jgi:hypothetical protein